MKKIALFLALAIVTVSFTDCTHARKGCKKNRSKIQKMRKKQSEFQSIIILMRTLTLLILFVLLSLFISSCVHSSKKCRTEHKAAKRKGTTGWRY